MRLNKKTIIKLKNIISTFDKEVKIFLFGSRVDDSKMGGDIDLIIISNKINFAEKLRIKREIFKQLEDEKIDIILANNKEDSVFVNYIFKETKTILL